MLDVALEHRMMNLHACDCVSADERHCIAHDDAVAALEGQLGGAGVWKADVVAPG